jgi:putative glycosyl hydrolase-like family 15 (GHL15) protein/Big-like domain-containing protein
VKRFLALAFVLAIGLPAHADTVPPAVAIDAPTSGATVCGTVRVAATAMDNVGVAGVQFKYDGADFGAEVTAPPYVAYAYTADVPNGTYTLTAVARDAAGNQATSAPVPITVSNTTPYSACRFIPTFLAYYGGGPTLAIGDAPQLAKYDLLDLDRWRYYDINPGNSWAASTWAAVRGFNPNVQIYVYEMGAEVSNYSDDTPVWYLNGLGRYEVSRGHPMGSLNGANPELFLLDASGNRAYSLIHSNVAAGQYWYLMDFGVAAYQTYWLTAVQADIVGQPWVGDGVFADNCVTLGGGGLYSGIPSAYPTNAAWSAAMNAFAGAIATGLHASGQKLWCNRGETRSADGAAAWLALDAGASPPDVLLEEGAFAVAWGPWAVQFYQEWEWKRQVDTLAAIRNSKVAVLSHTMLLQDQAGTDNWGRPVTFWQALWYSIGSFLLGKNDGLRNAYFMFAGGEGFSRLWWYDEYDRIDLGRALGPYAATSAGAATVYRREFEKGFVYVNPSSDDAAAVALPQGLRQLTHDNLNTPQSELPVVTQIALDRHHAAILLKP